MNGCVSVQGAVPDGPGGGGGGQVFGGGPLFAPEFRGLPQGGGPLLRGQHVRQDDVDQGPPRQARYTMGPRVMHPRIREDCRHRKRDGVGHNTRCCLGYRPVERA